LRGARLPMERPPWIQRRTRCPASFSTASPLYRLRPLMRCVPFTGSGSSGSLTKTRSAKPGVRRYPCSILLIRRRLVSAEWPRATQQWSPGHGPASLSCRRLRIRWSSRSPRSHDRLESAEPRRAVATVHGWRGYSYATHSSGRRVLEFANGRRVGRVRILGAGVHRLAPWKYHGK
jgi:hypothetical protein